VQRVKNSFTPVVIPGLTRNPTLLNGFPLEFIPTCRDGNDSCKLYVYKRWMHHTRAAALHTCSRSNALSAGRGTASWKRYERLFERMPAAAIRQCKFWLSYVIYLQFKVIGNAFSLTFRVDFHIL
jgi:hypothetical protein